MLKSFAPDDRAAMVQDGKVVVTCEFCSVALSVHTERSGRGVRGVMLYDRGLDGPRSIHLLQGALASV